MYNKKGLRILSTTSILFVTFSFIYILFAIYYRNILANGDEVHYLVSTISVIEDHDLFLENNYKNKDYSLFRPEKNLDHLTYTGTDGHEYPVHGLLYPFILAPAYIVGGRLGVMIFNAALTSLLISRIFSFTNYISKSKKYSLFISSVLGVSIPLFPFSILVFTETIGAIFILEMVRNLFTRKRFGLFIPTVATFLPWVNVRFLPISLAILLIWGYKSTHKKHKRVLFFIPTISMTLYFIFLKATSGTFNPAQPFEQLNVSTTSGNIFFNFLNHIVDRQYGLIIYTPLLLFLIPGLLDWYKKKKVQVLTVIFLCGIYLLPVLRYSDWQGGYTPPGRYLVPIIPLIVPSIVFYAKKSNFFVLSSIFLCAIWGVFSAVIMLFLTTTHGFLYIDGSSPVLWYVFLKTNINIYNLVPAFYPKAQFTFLHFVWILLIGVCTLFFIKLKRFNHPKMIK